MTDRLQDNVLPLRPEFAHAIDAEQAVLGALLVDPDAFTVVRDVLSTADFSVPAHARVYGACCALAEDDEPIDPVLVCARLQAAGQLGRDVPPGLPYELANAVGTAGNVAHYAGVVTTMARVRRVQAAAQGILERGRDAGKDPEAFLRQAASSLAAAADADPKRSGAELLAPRAADVEQLRRRQSTRFIPLGDLPEAHGWGEYLDKLTGGGLAPGSLIGLGAAGTGAGKTAFLMQLLDGLAMRSAAAAQDPDATVPLTPVVILSEMAPEDLESRTLGRLLDVSGHIFSAGASAKRFHEWGWVDAQYERAAQLMAQGGLYRRLAAWQRIARPILAGAPLIAALEKSVDAWLLELERAHPQREIIPVLAVDPINRFLPMDGRSEVETLGETADLLDRLIDRRRWICAVTADTNKTAAKEPGRADDGPSGAAVFRGTMQLLHSFDLTLVLTPDEVEADGVRRYGVWIDKNRHGRNGIGVEFRWLVKNGLRFIPETEDAWRSRTGEGKTVTGTQTRARVVAKVAELAAAGVEVTRRSLRNHARTIGVPRDGLDATVDAAIVAGVLAEAKRVGRGGGSMLVPTGKCLEEGTAGSGREPPATSEKEVAGAAPSTSGQIVHPDLSGGNHDGSSGRRNWPANVAPTVTDSQRREPENAP